MGIDIGVRHVVDFLANHPFLLFGAFVLYVFIFLAAVIFNGRKPGKNPFGVDFRRPSETFVHEAKARDAVLKQRFKVTKVPENVDVIIIGSGIGGLTSGVLLGRAGKKVLVLEQHDTAGGCCHTFVEKGFEFDTGIHYIGNVGEGSTNKTLMDQLTGGQLKWAKMDDEFDTIVLGEGSSLKRYPMKSGKERYIQNLIDMFPQEKEAVKKYMDLIEDASKTFFGIVLLKVLPRIIVRLLVNTGLYWLVCSCYRKGYVSRSLQDILDSLTDNAELKVVLSYICGDYGVIPKDCPFVFHSVVIKHYMDGAYYPVGGPSEIVFHMVQTIEKAGGRVLMQAPVTNIVCDNTGTAVGVKVGGKNEVEINARYIISDAGVYSTLRNLLPEKVASKSYLYPLTESIGPSLSFITAFMGLEGSPKELKLPAGNIWMYNTLDLNKTISEYGQLKSDDLDNIKVPFGYISFPGSKDPEWDKKHPGKSSVLVITLAKFEWFQEWENEKLRGRGERYEGIKDDIGHQLWHQCLELFPQLDGKRVYMEVGTPVTNKYYLGFLKGEMYGLDQGHERFSADTVSKLRADTDIPGLYLTGQDTLTCGFTSALISGVLCCSKILHRNVYGDLQKLHKKVKAEIAQGKTDELKKKE